MDEDELDQRHWEYLQRMTTRQRLARDWSIKWPAYVTIILLLIAAALLAWTQ